MKKIISGIVAFAMTGTVMTACGKIDESAKETDIAVTLEANEEIKVTDKKETTAETNETEPDSDENETGSDNEKESDEEISVNKNEEGFVKTLYEYFGALNKSDYNEALNYFYPAEIVDGLVEVSKIQNTDLTALVAADIEAKNYEITDIKIESEMTKNEIQDAAVLMDEMYFTVEIIKSYGEDIDSLDVNQREEISNIISFPEANGYEVKERYTVTEGYDVTVNYLVDGEPDKDYFYVLYVDGEGWMLQNSMRKYIKNSRQSSANADSKTIITFYNTALIELDEMGANLSGTFIVCSDESKNYNVPDDFSLDELNETVGYYYTFEEDCEYFVIIVDGVCQYCAVLAFEDTVGTYPVSALPESFENELLETEKVDDINDYTFDELYELSKEIVK